MENDKEPSIEPFLSLLPAELAQLIASFVDEPSRLALALTSRHLYKSLNSGRHNVLYDSVWIFLEDCVRLGSFGLLKYAHENGARVDLALLDLSVRENQEDIAIWLAPLLFPFIESHWYFFRDIIFLAAHRGMTRLYHLLHSNGNPFVRKDYLEMIAVAAAGGQFDLIMELIKESGKEIDVALRTRITVYASQGGHLDLVERFNTPEQIKSRINLILQGGVDGGQKEVIQFAMSQGADPSKILTSYTSKILLDPECIRYYEEVAPGWHPLSSWRFAANEERPNLECFKITAGNNTHCSLDLERFSFGSEALGSVELCRRLVTPKYAQERFECIKFLESAGHLTWSRDYVYFTASWVSLEMLQWLVEKGVAYWDPVLNKDRIATTYHRILESHIVGSGKANIEIVEFCVGHLEEIKPDLIFSCLEYLQNPIDVLEVFVRNFGLDRIREKFFFGTVSEWETLAKRWNELLLGGPKKPGWAIDPRHRVRIKVWLKVLTWLVSKRFIVRPSLEVFRSVNHPHFLSELRDLIARCPIDM